MASPSSSTAAPVGSAFFQRTASSLLANPLELPRPPVLAKPLELPRPPVLARSPMKSPLDFPFSSSMLEESCTTTTPAAGPTQMDTPSTKKREGQQILAKDMSTNKKKRLKKGKPDYLLMFLQAISLISEEKKSIVRKLGFCSILDFSCSSKMDDIFIWLVDKFDTKSNTMTFENGFKFNVTPSFVHIITGIPFGGNDVQIRSNEEACKLKEGEAVQVPTSVEHLCELLTNDLDEVSFSRIFMQLLLSAFLAPIEDGFGSDLYSHNLVDVSRISQLDWCSFTLKWLSLCIEKYRTAKSKGVEQKIGGCKLILVAPYFEFLITSELILGNTIPRISVWTTNVVNLYIALDRMPGSNRSFGRLARKHISSTIFNGLKQPFEVQLPVEIQDFIDAQFQIDESNYDEAKRKLECLTKNFYSKVVKNSIPAIKNYIKDEISKDQMSRNIDNYVLQLFDAKIPVLQIPFERMTQPELSEKEVEVFLKKLYSFGSLAGRYKREHIVEEFKSQCTIADSEYVCDLPTYPSLLESIMLPDFINNSLPIQSDSSIGFSQYLENEIQGWIEEGRQSSTSNQIMDFYSPDIEFPESPIVTTPNFKSNYNSNQLQTPVSAMDASSKSAIHRNSYSAPAEDRYVAAPKKVCPGKANWSGLSLNERLTGKRTASKTGFVTFELFEDDENDASLGIQPQIVKAKPDLESVDPLLKFAMDNYGKQLLENDTVTMTSDFRVPGSFATASEIARQPIEQVIFANAFEHEFYNSLINSGLEYSPRIFEIEKVWVDQRTLILSMSPGGWIHPHVIDCFGKLSNTEQLYRMKKGKISERDIVRHIVIKDFTAILMDPKLNFSDPQYRNLFGVINVGFRLEKAGLVHIPIPCDKQWILVVVNFIDEKFDVLNSDKSEERFETIVSTVIFNFKNLFVKNFPGCRMNVREFPTRHIQVPKHHFRYDSGLFVMQFIRWFDGLQVKHFSNADLQGIREKVSCELAINTFNEHQVPLVKRFLAIHAPDLLR